MYSFQRYTILTFLIITTLFVKIAGSLPFRPFFAVVAFTVIAFIIFRRVRLKVLSEHQSELEAAQERINILEEDIKEKNKLLGQLPQKEHKASLVFEISQKLIRIVDPNEVFDFLIKTVKDLFLEADNILLLAIQKRSLRLVRSFKSKAGVVIKEKTGDVLDTWVLMHNLSLFIEDITQDFRFDYDKVAAFRQRHMRSVIGSPLSIGDRVLGILRMESPRISAFSLDDLRILRGICDIGVVVLQRARYFKKIQDLALKDPLTSLFLRGHFQDRLQQELKRAYSDGTSIGMLMLDIDNFKKINDACGHIVGDLVLKRLAKILKQAAGRAGNVVCRLGGEEFILFIVKCDKERLTKVADQIRKKVESSTVRFRRRSIKFTVSIGGVVYPDSYGNVEQLLGKLDGLLYRAKREGRNRVCIL